MWREKPNCSFVSRYARVEVAVDCVCVCAGNVKRKSEQRKKASAAKREKEKRAAVESVRAMISRRANRCLCYQHRREVLTAKRSPERGPSQTWHTRRDRSWAKASANSKYLCQRLTRRKFRSGWFSINNEKKFLCLERCINEPTNHSTAHRHIRAELVSSAEICCSMSFITRSDSQSFCALRDEEEQRKPESFPCSGWGARLWMQTETGGGE